MKKKVPWLKYEEKKVSHEQAREVENAAKTKLQNLHEINKEIKASFE